MGTIKIVESSELPWRGPRDGETGDDRGWVDVADDDLRDGAIRVHHAGSETAPYMHEVRVPPNYETVAHAHREAEIMYVLDGEMRFGSRIAGPGSSIYISAMTLYGFSTGPAGCRFLNFRPREDTSLVTREQFAAERSREQQTV